MQDSIFEDLSDIMKETKDKDFDDAREIRNEIRKDLFDPEWKQGKITEAQRGSLLSLFDTFNIGKDDNIASVLYVEQWVTDIKSRNLEDSVEESILDKLGDVYEELIKEDNKEAKEELEDIIEDLKDSTWKVGKITQEQRELLIEDTSQLLLNIK